MAIFKNRNLKPILPILQLSPLLLGLFLFGKVLKAAYELKMKPSDTNCVGKLKMKAGGFYKPKESQTSPLGEDAYFVCEEAQTVGLADGVGSWSEVGIDAGAYARELMENTAAAIKQWRDGFINPKEVLIEAHSKTKCEGSCTACIITLVDHNLHAVNVGDSGFMVLREGKVVYRSPMRHHGFNYPFQLSNTEKSDQASAEQDLIVEVVTGDIVVAATDGLFDNMHPHEIAEISSHGKKQGLTETQLAWILAEIALHIAADEGRNTPFSEAAKTAGYDFPGGKMDDITVVVAYIT